MSDIVAKVTSISKEFNLRIMTGCSDEQLINAKKALDMPRKPDFDVLMMSISEHREV